MLVKRGQFEYHPVGTLKMYLLSVVAPKNRAFPPRLHFQQLAAALPPRNHSPHCCQESSTDPGRPQPLPASRGWPPSPRVPGTLKPLADPLETVPLPQRCRNRDPNLLCPLPPPLQKVGRTRLGKGQRCERLLRLEREAKLVAVFYYGEKLEHSVSRWRCVGSVKDFRTINNIFESPVGQSRETGETFPLCHSSSRIRD